MKRLTAKARQHQFIVRRKRARRVSDRKLKAHRLRFNDGGQPGQRPSRRKKWQRSSKFDISTVHLDAPVVFGLLQRDARTNLLRFLRDLRRYTLVSGCKVYINFADTRQMYPEGTLLFAAELDRIVRAKQPRVLVRCNRPTDNIVEQVLQHLGLLQMMRRLGKASITADNVKYWQVNTAAFVDGSKTEPLVKEYEKYFPGESKRLFRGLTEAMTNCKQHAYESPRRDGTAVAVSRNWWMFSQVKDGSLFAAICDLGMGIDRSLMDGKRWSIATVLKLVDKTGIGRKHSSFIKAAMVLGKSRTGKQYRGRGLQDIKDVIDSIGTGWLRIYSNRGRYDYVAQSKTENRHDYADSILGTLVLWQIPLPTATVNDGSANEPGN